MLTSAVAAPDPPTATTPRSETGNPAPAAPCVACGLSEAQFRQTGLLGCDACYQAFAPLIAAAVAELHGVTLPPVPQRAQQEAPPPPPVTVPPPPLPVLPDDVHAPLPWPTRRAAPRPAK